MSGFHVSESVQICYAWQVLATTTPMYTNVIYFLAPKHILFWRAAINTSCEVRLTGRTGRGAGIFASKCF